ncbi:MAG: YeeE/YedE thiosulfate transporter family protein [Proteobacteria bacterium]|nr:YeeE/YedE thiosulfate transporter family protein [Pseudomonadota bacterium]
MKSLFVLISGIIFGLGLIVSGMVNPLKVIGFLDVFGDWDPSLALVMGGAISVGIIAFTYADKRVTTLLGDELQIPKAKKNIDKKLVLGSLIFGVGWGVAGFCPGPGLVSLGMGYIDGLIFVISMITGMLILQFIQKERR